MELEEGEVVGIENDNRTFTLIAQFPNGYWIAVSEDGVFGMVHSDHIIKLDNEKVGI